MFASASAFALVIATLGVFAVASEDFTGSGLVDGADAKASLTAELSALGGEDARLQTLQEELQWMYASLPKNSQGNLDHMATRYALHRFFLYRSGWHIRGLEPRLASSPSGEEWVPDFLQRLLEERVGESGVGLQELAAFAAAVMDLVQKEADGRLKTAMRLHSVNLDGHMDRAKAEQVLGTFYASFLKEGHFPATSSVDVEEKKRSMSRQYPGWNASQSWISGLLDKDLAYDSDGTVSFSAASGMASEIGEKYYQFNDAECKDLKSALRETESRKAGRVRLSVFYKRGRYSHWRFNEKVDYLRDLGALDESDPKQAYVIIPNYVMAMNNCLDASHLYSVCCRNQCEDLMQHLEKKVGSESAAPGHIANLVASLPSESVQAPRNLSSGLLARLDEVAAHNGGRVPLHGRLFAQWMHHAYPMECPYPHEAGSTNPQFADDWMRTSGLSVAATEHEMQQVVDQDTCSIDEQGKPSCDETEDLQWTATEEIFATVVPAESARFQVKFGGVFFLTLAASVGVLAWKLSGQSLGADKKHDDPVYGFDCGARKEPALVAMEPRHLAAVGVLMLVVFLLDLLDGRIFALAVVCSGAGLAVQRLVWDRRTSALDLEARLAAKCCV